MEIKHLKMTAFGPYKQTETIDFEELGDYRLYVISGSTGAGKTTIFDAICFALFGSASGADRDSQIMLRSDFASDDTHTSVELIFELNRRTYRVFRQLAHMKKGNRTRTGDKYEFYERRADGEIPAVDRQNVSEIDRKIEELLGLTEDQFKQIVMLPQGEFRKLLTSKTENKEEILRRLFKTESYQQITEQLKQKKDQAEEAHTAAEQTLSLYMQQLQAMLPERENALLFEVLKEEHYNSRQIIGGLDEEIEHYSSRMTEDEKQYREAYDAQLKKQAAFHEAKVTNDQFRQLDEKQKRLEELNAQIPAYRAKEEKLHLAERAEGIVAYETNVQDWRSAEKEKSANLKSATERRKKAAEAYERTRIAYEDEKSKQEKRDEWQRQLDRLKRFLPTVKEIDQQKQELNGLEKDVSEAESSLEATAQELKTNNQKLQDDEKRLQKLGQMIDEGPAKEQKLVKMRDRIRIIQKYKKIQTTYKEDEHVLSQKKKTYEAANQAYEELEKTWLGSQASMLAEHLEDGEACPVCGSVHHPSKASSVDAAATKEQLEDAKADMAQKNDAYRTMLAKVQSDKNQLEEVQSELREEAITEDDLEKVEQQLLEDGQRLKKELEALESTKEEQKQLKTTYDRLRTHTKGLEEQREKMQKDVQEKKINLEKKKAMFTERLREIPEAFQDLDALQRQIDSTSEQLTKMLKEWEEVQTQLQQAAEEQTKAVASEGHAQEQLKEAASRKEKAETSFERALNEAGFDTEESYVQSKMSASERERNRQSIEEFKQMMATLKERIKDLQVSLEHKERVDPDKLREELEQAKEMTEKALEQKNASKEHHTNACKMKERITQAAESVKEQERQLGLHADLYDVIRGQNMQKISFERYLQIEYLEQIIDTANMRLRHLSNGQFLLSRSERQESHGRQSGLNFDIYDAYTGQTRDVKTLSGGEKFNASLCLALGMSDVIQSFQGNVSIQTMFIDEGFGSLDEESLHKAIDALIELQKSGRTIGVISHVEELKTILPAALEVTKTKEGDSKTAFVLT